MGKSIHRQLKEQGYEVAKKVVKEEGDYGCPTRLNCFVPGVHHSTAEALNEMALLTYSGAYEDVQILDAELALKGERNPEFVPSIPLNLFYVKPNEENTRMKRWRKKTKITLDTEEVLGIRGKDGSFLILNKKLEKK